MAKPACARPGPDNGMQIGGRQCLPKRPVPVRRSHSRQGGETEREFQEPAEAVGPRVGGRLGNSSSRSRELDRVWKYTNAAEELAGANDGSAPIDVGVSAGTGAPVCSRVAESKADGQQRASRSFIGGELRALEKACSEMGDEYLGTLGKAGKAGLRLEAEKLSLPPEGTAGGFDITSCSQCACDWT